MIDITKEQTQALLEELERILRWQYITTTQNPTYLEVTCILNNASALGWVREVLELEPYTYTRVDED